MFSYFHLALWYATILLFISGYEICGIVSFIVLLCYTLRLERVAHKRFIARMHRMNSGY